MGGKQASNTTTSTAPWSGQQPFLTKGFDEAAKIYGQGPQQYFPGQTYTDMSGTTLEGLRQTGNIARSPSVVNTAAGQLDKTMRGDYLNPSSNPYLKSTFNAAAGELNENFNEEQMPALAGMFGTQGGLGNSSLDLAAGKAAGEHGENIRDLAANIYGNNYSAERNRQTEALSAAPGIREAQYGDASRLTDVGKAYEGQQAKVLEDKINRFNYAQNAPIANLQDYMALISGNYGSTSTSRSSGGGGSPLSTGLGAAGLIASLLG